MIDTGTLNFQWSQAMIAGFAAAGATHAVISPGSRSTPLALAMLRQPALECHVAVDERSAAYFALGIAKASRRPVLLLATSGTAPANWLPAVIEASQSAVPMILLSADRPPELQGCGANQTIDQVDLFGTHVRASHHPGPPAQGFDPAYLWSLAARVWEQSSWPHPGPVHVNQPFREPLLPAGDATPAMAAQRIVVSPPSLLPAPDAIEALASAIGGRRGIIVCGETAMETGFADALTALAARLDCPILAEPLSNLRFGPHDRSHLCIGYNSWLGDQLARKAMQPEWLLRFGSFPVTRQLQALLDGGAPLHALVEPWPRWSDPQHKLTHVFRAEPLAFCEALLAAAPHPAPADWRASLSALETITNREPSGHIAVLIDEVPPGTAVFVGNSLAIRQMDSHSGSSDKPLSFFGNRGASGIDGNISTALGIAAIHGRVVALLGDLTCQHDLGGLALAQGRDAVIVAVNNRGGGIFDHLPQAALPEFEQGWRTPQQIRFEHAALSFGFGYALAEDDQAFRNALHHALDAGGPQLIELRIS